MKKKYLLILLMPFFVSVLNAQTISTETFETETNSSTSFTDNSQVFNITSQSGGPFDIYTHPVDNWGWNGTTIDNRFIDNSSAAVAGVNAGFTISSAGATSFRVVSFWIYLSRSNLSSLGTGGSLTVVGKLGGVTQFTATSSSGFNTNASVNNGFTLINFATFGGSNNTTKNIDQLVITTGGLFEYASLDAFRWSTVPATPPVVLTCPTNTTVAACQTQAAVNAAFATWLATASGSGGTSGILTNNNTGAPAACGGSTTVTFTYTSTTAPLTTTCQATFTVATAPTISLTCPTNTTVAAGQTQATVNTQFATWLATASGSGGCNGILTNNNTGAPAACGGSTTVTFTYTSNCAPLTTTCQATFTVSAPPPVVLTCPTNTTVAACQTQAAVNTAFATWLSTASGSGGTSGILTNNNTGAPSAAGGSSTVTFTYTSTCTPITTTCQATFTVATAPTVSLTCPTNTTVAACQTQAAVNTQFATWLATASGSGGCNGILTNNNTGAPAACGGSTTVTFTYTSTTAPLTTTCQATFTVATAPTVSLTCPTNTTVAAGQTQAAVNVAFATWLATASGSGGCNGLLTNNNTGAPSAAGGSTTITFTYTSNCAPVTTTCQATFTVSAPPLVVLTCPTNTTVAACQTQAAVNAAFATWLATASGSGGTSGILTNNNTGAPAACGGSTTVTFTYTSTTAPLTTTCQATFTVAATPTVSLTCPTNTTVAAGQTQAAVNTQFATWLATVSGSGGCNGILTNNNTGAPAACGGSTTVTFTYTSNCAPISTTCQATFTVSAPPPVVLTCPTNTTVAACQTQAAVNTAFATWLATASGSGGANGILTNNNTGAPTACGGSTTVTFTYTSNCAPISTTCQATFTVATAPTVVLTCPANFTTASGLTQSQVNTAFATWLATASANGGCNGILTNNNTGAPSANGGSTTVTFTYSSTCAPLTTTCQATFTVCNVAAPVTPNQTFCASNNPTVANLVATGTAIQWYSLATGGTALTSTTALATGNYYASQTVSGCESTRTTVSVTVNPITSAPTASAQTFCASTNPTVANLIAAGNAIQWYATATGGTALTSTTALATGNYYASQTVSSCESITRTMVSVTIIPITPAPSASAQTFCASTNPTVANLIAAGNAIQWYATATGGTALTSTTALATGNYYASQTVSGCESTRTTVSVTVNPITPAPTASAQTFCANANPTVANLIATGNAIQWYATATGGTVLTSTTALSTGNYYASQTVSGCESTRTTVSVTVISTPTFTNTTATNGTVGVLYTLNAGVTGNSQTVIYSVLPALPAGLTLNTASGQISGTPTTATVSTTYTVSATQGTCVRTQTYTFAVVCPAITFTNTTATTATVGSSYNLNAGVIGNTQTVVYSVAPALPAGLTLNTATGVINGTPTAATASTTYTVTATQGTCVVTQTYTFAVVCPAITFTNTTATTATVGNSYNLNAGVTGNTQTVVYSVAPALPAGLTLNTATGVINGTPTAATASTTYTVSATQGTCVVTQTYTFAVVCPTMTFVTASLPNRDYNQSYSQAISVNGNTSTLAFSISAGTLPTGFTLSSTGIISGTSTAIGVFNFTVLAIDANGCSVSANYSIGLNQIPITVTANALSKIYGTADPVLTYSVVPALLSGDSFTGGLSRLAGENVGIYAINQGNLSAGPNYIITYVGANFTINKAPQTITWSQNFVIGCDGLSSYTLNASASSGLPVSYNSANTAVATISGNTLNIINQGTVNITASQAGDSNYLPATNVINPVIISQPSLIRKHWKDVVFFDNSSNSYSNYQWYKNGVAVPGATEQYFRENGNLNGSYYATAIRNGVLITSCALVINETTPEFDIKIYPNPVGQGVSFEAETTLPTSSLTNAKIQIYSSLGALISETAVTGSRTTVTAPNTTGIFIIRLRLSNGNVYSVNLLVK